MKIHTNYIACLLPAVLLSACETATPEDLQEMGSPEAPKAAVQADTFTNPKIDSTYVGEVSNSDGYSFVDIAMISSRMFLTRSDGRLQYYDYDGVHAPTYVGYVAQNWNHLEYINSYDWGMVANSDARQQIFYKASNVPVLMGSYPAGVTYVTDIAARARYGGLLLDIWIVVPNGGPSTAIRYGLYDKTKGYIAWNANNSGGMGYSSGFTYGPGPDGAYHLFSMLEYTRSYLLWWTPGSNGDAGNASYEAGLVNAGYTDHAYLHPEGHYDSFEPSGLSYLSYDNMYYGIDPYYNSQTGRHAWVLAKMPPSAIMP